MAVARRTRTLPVPQRELWELIADPHHMPRWWPGVMRMEAVDDDRFTQVFKTHRGHTVRADFHVLESDPPRSRTWQQEVVGTPFERVLTESIIEVQLEPAGEQATSVTLVHQQKLKGYSRTGGFLLRRATRGKLDEALDGLAQISAGG
jgi:uncharacterized protein YndB with AHSA1/START domain